MTFYISDKNTLKQSVNDSDLGCYPYENSFNGSVVASSFKAL